MFGQRLTDCPGRVQRLALDTADEWLANPVISGTHQGEAQVLPELVYVTHGGNGTNWSSELSDITSDDSGWELETWGGVMLVLNRGRWKRR
jgi:hypothetical protein